MTRSGLTWATGLTAPTNSVNSRTLELFVFYVFPMEVIDGWQMGGRGLTTEAGVAALVRLQAVVGCIERTPADVFSLLNRDA